MVDAARPYDDSIRRLVALVLELGSEESESSRKSPGGRSFAKTEILLHAMSVFNRQGLEETSVQDILDAANISRRTFYKYFSGKIDVLENIYSLALRVIAISSGSHPKARARPWRTDSTWGSRSCHMV